MLNSKILVQSGGWEQLSFLAPAEVTSLSGNSPIIKSILKLRFLIAYIYLLYYPKKDNKRNFLMLIFLTAHMFGQRIWFLVLDS